MRETHDTEEITRGLVIRIDGGVATLLVGEEQEEWDFPLQLLPEHTSEDCVVLLTGEGYGLTPVGLAPERIDSVESRLRRGVNQRRLARIA